MRPTLLSSLLALLATLAPQQGEAPDPLAAQSGPKPQSAEALEALRQTHGTSWKVWADRRDGYAELIFGGSAQAPFAPLSDEDRTELARLFIAETVDLHGVAPSSLRAIRVDFLPLGQINSTDKWNAKFQQEFDGVPVADAFVNVLMNEAGEVLSLQATAAPHFEPDRTTPLQSEDAARAQALRLFELRSAAGQGFASTPELMFLRLPDDKLQEPHLVWEVDVYPAARSAEPEAWRFWIEDATGTLLLDRDLIQHFDVGGQVTSMATPGTLPDTASNPETQQGMGHIRLTSSAGTVYADANGNFNFPGASGPLNVTVDYVGTYNDVRNQAGNDYVLSVQAQTGQGNTIVLNPSSQALVTAQANCYRGVGDCRDWITSVIPTDTTPNFQAVSNANLNSTCNAYYDGVSINMYQAGGGCVNTGYSTVIVHEYGHWMNDLYSTGNGFDGMGEGNADVFAMYLFDVPIVGQDFCGNGCHIRDGNNTRPYCGDGNNACYGQVHTDGEVWMGAAWKIRQRLKATHGSSAGGLTADTLFLSWMNAYNQSTIDSIIEVQWLTLDDNDGNIDNGTPNYNDIDQGFLAQSFPGYSLALISISNVTQLPDSPSGAGPFVVNADITPLVSPPLLSAELFYRVNGGAWSSTFMSSVGGNTYTGSIPGQAAPATVDYYVRATDISNNTTTSPKTAPTTSYEFNIGTTNVLFADDFESAGDNGWTHGTFGDTSNSQDDWQHGQIFGQSGDPGAAHSGTRVWGNDLGGSGFNGAYQNFVHNYLRSPAIDCSSAVGTKLRFWRWLTVESGQWDQALIKVNGVQVWANEISVDTLDSSWTLQEIDISSIADGNPSVQVEFSLQSDVTITFGGWTIDDFEVLYLGGGGFPDCNSNGVDDAQDISSGTSQDCNQNGSPDECESFADCNQNSVPDECELTGNDCNQNGIPDECDADCNANGTPDDCESLADCNANGTPDVCETFSDCNQNGIPDECDLAGNDCNQNGIPDECDTDCNLNGTPDDCESLVDCNQNGTPDVCETFSDCNQNGIPDECDTDCNANGTPDDCESLADCNQNGTPDECEQLADCNTNGTPDICETFADCNTNGIPDECDLAGNDCNQNGVPDECDTDCNSNGTPDDCEQLVDCNANGTPDVCETFSDCNANGIPDECDADCNQNGTPDDCETLADCNANGTPDVCETFSDCNLNGVPDECDIDCNSNGTPDDCEQLVDCNANGTPDVCETFSDCNQNGIPDECDPDCNANGTPDDCETLADCNQNGTPDECELAGNDCNQNGVPDECDTDCNANGTPDECEQLTDCNQNGTPDVCETFADCNQNGIPDECDLVGNDCNQNGIPDECDTDCNANGTPDDCESLADCNTNGTPDVCEQLTDCNQNGTPDVCETFADCNQNGIPDECDLVGNDCNQNGIPDECDTDCNANGTPDDCESLADCNANGTPDECEQLADCNANGTPDVCETFADCNQNGIPDECDLVGNDCNLNGIPDECDIDCNANGTPDDCETLSDCNANGTPDVCESLADCDANGIPDECEVFDDCNANGVPDVCDINQGTSADADGNGIPDECAPGIGFCFGDGSGAACPCGNAAAPGEGCANSSGLGGLLSAGGSNSAAADDLSLDVSQLPSGQFVLLFSGSTQVAGGNGIPFGDGLRCAGGDVLRHGVRVTGAGGTATWSGGLAAAHGWTTGDVRTFQGWYRDPVASPCGQNFNLTNGMQVTYTP